MSGEAVPITALQGVAASQAETLSEKGIADVEALAATSVDDLVDFLDVSLDEAESILASAQSIVAAKNVEVGTETDGEAAEEAETPEEAEVAKADDVEPAAAEEEPAESADAAADGDDASEETGE